MRGQCPSLARPNPGAGGDGAERAGRHPDVPSSAAPQDSWVRLAVSLPAPGGPRDRNGRQGPEARLECAGFGDRDKGTNTAIPGRALYRPPGRRASLPWGTSPRPQPWPSSVCLPTMPRTQDKPQTEQPQSGHVWVLPRHEACPSAAVPGASALVYRDRSGYSPLSDPGPQPCSRSEA